MRSNNYAYVNGRFVPEAEASVSIFDRGFLYGDGVFETMRVYNGSIFRVYEHLERLFGGLKHLVIESPLSWQELQAVCEALIERNRIRDGMVRVYVTAGASNIGPSARVERGATLVAVAQERKFSRIILQRVIVASQRLEASLSRLKSANRLPYIMARQEVERAHVDEAIMLDHAGNVIECTACNLFAVKQGEIFTPPLSDGPLPGITRQIIFVLASQLGYKIHERSFGVEFLNDVDELFATSSLVEIAPIAEFVGRRLTYYIVAARLHKAYQDLVGEELDL
jgi:branched-chain amino acid aminotransferase